MAILNILEFPDPRLRTIAKAVERVDDDLRQLIDDMFETMYEAPGIGLAATQVNVHLQVVVMDLSEDRSEPRVFINPEILSHSDHEVPYTEGCLSFPGITGDVERVEKAIVQFRDADGAPVTVPGTRRGRSLPVALPAVRPGGRAICTPRALRAAELGGQRLASPAAMELDPHGHDGFAPGACAERTPPCRL